MVALGIEGFAVTLAHLSHYPPRQQAAVLRRLEVDEREFERAALAHPRAIADAAVGGDDEPGRRFDEHFASTRDRLREAQPAVDDLAPLEDQLAKHSLATIAAAAPVTPGNASDHHPEGCADETTSPPKSAEGGPPLPFTGAAESVLRAEATLLPATVRLPQSKGGTLDPAPPRNHEERGFETWTVERYAAFSADRRAGDADAVRLTYGVIDARQEDALVAYMNRRFAISPHARERWATLVAGRLEAIAKGRPR